MNEPYHAFFHLSIVHFMAFPEVMRGSGPILETLERIAGDPFFTAVEIGPINDGAQRKAAARLLTHARLAVSFGAQPIVLANQLNPNSPDATERRRAMSFLCDAVEQAAELGAKRLALLSGPAPRDARLRREQLDILADFLHDLSGYAEQSGLEGLTLETFDEDMDKRALVGSSRSAAELALKLRREHPGFGLMVDLSHLPLQHETIAESLEAVAPVLVHAHLGNCVLDPSLPAYGDQHPRLGYPGGENDVAEVTSFLNKLFEIGFLGTGKKPFVGFEVKPQPEETSAMVLAGVKRAFYEAWARVEAPRPVAEAA
jgi:sugar phosphate isomerase/epimerase